MASRDSPLFYGHHGLSLEGWVPRPFLFAELALLGPFVLWYKPE
jgi:hypothetical protein